MRILEQEKESEIESRSVISDTLQPHGLYSPWNSPGQNTGVGSCSLEWVAHSLLQGNLPNPGIKPRCPALQADSLPAEPQWKPKNTGVGSLSLLQQIFLTQDLNWGPPHCRQILYQLNYQGSLHVLLNWSQKRTFLFNKWKLCYSFGILYILRRRKNFR